MNLSFGNMTLELNVFNMCKQPYDEDNEIENFELTESIMEEQNLGSLSNLMHICSSDDLLEFDIANDSRLLDSVQVPEDSEETQSFEELGILEEDTTPKNTFTDTLISDTRVKVSEMTCKSTYFRFLHININNY